MTTSAFRQRVRRALTRRPARLPGAERGSFSFAVTIWAMVVIALAGLVIDGGLAISQREQAASVAEQVARNVANDVDDVSLRDNPGKPVVRSDGLSGTSGYCLTGDVAPVLTASGVANSGPAGGTPVAPSDCTVNGATVTVTVHIVYKPVLISLFYPGTFTAVGTANATAQVGQ